MRKWFCLGLFSLGTALLPLRAFAVINLMDVFHDALGNDPTFQSAQSQYLANKENLPIARSYLLPNVNVQGQTLREFVKQVPVVIAEGVPFTLMNQSFYDTSNIYTLNISQPIFNYSAWYSMRNASYQVKQAEATFAASAQDLMMRTAQSYFSVMQASDTLRYTLAEKKAVGEQLRQSRQQYQVGMIAITAMSEAQANYDSIAANEIAARDNLAVAMEQLRTITGRTYPELMGVNSHLPLLRPNPPDINQWVRTAECQNYTLKAAIENTNAAQQNIEVKRGGHFPDINAVAGYNYNQQSNPGQFGFSKLQTYAAGVSVNVPIYEGGLVNAQTQQADYQYQQAISNMEFTHRSVMAQARDAYLGVITGINKIKADREAIVSAQVALTATTQGYQVGTRTILDVFNNQSSLYQTEINYSADQYNYLTNILSLKEAAGTLSPSDLIKVNSWLKDNVDIISSIANLNNSYSNYGTVSTSQASDQLKNKQQSAATPNKKSAVIKKASQTNTRSSAKQSSKKSSSALTTKHQKTAANAKSIKTRQQQTHSNKKLPYIAQKQNVHTAVPLNKAEQQKIAEIKQGETSYRSPKSSGQMTKIASIGYYTIELFDTRFEQHAEKFINDNHIKTVATYITIHNDKGEARYQVIYGQYKTLADAEKAIKQLPTTLRKLNPWVRKIIN